MLRKLWELALELYSLCLTVLHLYFAPGPRRNFVHILDAYLEVFSTDFGETTSQGTVILHCFELSDVPRFLCNFLGLQVSSRWHILRVKRVVVIQLNIAFIVAIETELRLTDFIELVDEFLFYRGHVSF